MSLNLDIIVLHKKYLKYKEKYLKLKSITGGMNSTLDILPSLPITNILEHLSDQDKINLIESHKNLLDIGIQYFNSPISYEKAIKIQPSNWRIFDKFRITSIEIKNIDELNAFAPHFKYIKKIKFILPEGLMYKGFNEPLGDSLSKLINLEIIYLSNNFNQELGNSLSKLKNLKEIDLGDMFNKPFGDSFANLSNLKKIIVGAFFKQKINPELQHITIQYYM